MDTSFLKSGNVLEKISVRSAVNAPLWLCVAISLPLFVAVLKTSGWIQIAFFLAALLPLLTFVVSYFYLLFTNPKYLRSEGYQLRAEAIELILGDKDNPLYVQAQDIVAITNPDFPQIAQKGDTEVI